jgi:hypothetical protein
MRASVVGLIILFFFQANAQIKEINFLGKEWYLVGYDFRIKARTYTPHFYTSLFLNSEFPSQAYKDQFDFDRLYTSGDFWRNLNTVSAGLVFRPFYHSKLKFIKQIEIAHNIELENQTAELLRVTKATGADNAFLNSFNLGYNPRFILSSPTVAEHLKFYIAGDAYGYIPFSGTIYTQADSKFLPNGSSGYKKANKYYSDRLSTNSVKYGAGLTAGVKMNIDCKWNLHIEASAFDVYTRHLHTKQTSQSGNYGVQVGLRYKFGVPSEDGSDNMDSSSAPVFW